MTIDEIFNSNFQQNILELKCLTFSDTFFKSSTRVSTFPCMIHLQVTILQLHMQIQNSFSSKIISSAWFSFSKFCWKISSNVCIKFFLTTGNLNAFLNVDEFVRQYVALYEKRFFYFWIFINSEFENVDDFLDYVLDIISCKLSNKTNNIHTYILTSHNIQTHMHACMHTCIVLHWCMYIHLSRPIYFNKLNQYTLDSNQSLSLRQHIVPD